jgi:hypothetical protein
MKSTGANRSFGLLLVAVFAVLGVLAYWGDRPSYIPWTGVAALFLLISLSVPRVLAPLRRGWLRIGGVLGRIMNPLVLAVVYAAVIIPLGGLMRLFRRDALARRRAPGVASYWVARTGEKMSADSLKDQF